MVEGIRSFVRCREVEGFIEKGLIVKGEVVCGGNSKGGK